MSQIYSLYKWGYSSNIHYFTVHISLPKGIIPTTDSAVIKTNAVVLQIHKEHLMTLDSPVGEALIFKNQSVYQ